MTSPQTNLPPTNISSSDAPPGPGNDAALAEAGRQALVREKLTGRQAQLSSSGLRPGWTTGACAAGAARAAWTALRTGKFPDPVEVILPEGRKPYFALTFEKLEENQATAAITKDAGDDPDVTNGAVIRATVTHGLPGSGITFCAGIGVGTVTRPGLPLNIGEPAINPVPRSYIVSNLIAAEQAFAAKTNPDIVVTISIDDGEKLAQHTWNPKIGILGGLSVLGTTGVIVPYSCSAWIASIREGIDVALASGTHHAVACTGSSSQHLAQLLYPDAELLDMGDFVGAVLKYLHKFPIPRLTICGGFAKITKLANGYLDLHSHRSKVDLNQLAELAASHGATSDIIEQIHGANTAGQTLKICQQAGVDLGNLVAKKAQKVASTITGPAVQVEIICTDRAGDIVGRANFS